MTARLVFLGTGASGGTQGAGRSRRRESSAALTTDAGTVLIDVTRDFTEQAGALDRIDAVLLTHAHRDAAGGILQLRRWWSGRDAPPIPVHGHPDAVDRVAGRHRTLDHCELHGVQPGAAVDLSGWQARSVEVPHSRDGFATVAWRLDGHGAAVTYASDLAEPADQLAQRPGPDSLPSTGRPGVGASSPTCASTRTCRWSVVGMSRRSG